MQTSLVTAMITVLDVFIVYHRCHLSTSAVLVARVHLTAHVKTDWQCIRAHIADNTDLGAVCFWQPIPSGLNLIVAAVLHDSLCVVSLLPCMADCCLLYTICKVEQFVLTNIKRRLLLLLLILIIVSLSVLHCIIDKWMFVCRVQRTSDIWTQVAYPRVWVGARPDFKHPRLLWLLTNFTWQHTHNCWQFHRWQLPITLY